MSQAGSEIETVSVKIAERLQSSRLLSGLRPLFCHANQSIYYQFCNLRKKIPTGPNRRVKLFNDSNFTETGREVMMALYERNILCALFNYAIENDEVSILGVESLPETPLSGYVYPLALGYCHSVAIYVGAKKLSAQAPYLNPVVSIVNDRLRFDRGNQEEGEVKFIIPDEETPWARLLIA